ncbi:MAG: DUF3122 domain-containing protein [Microcystaceae cyanobacterium]
MYRLIVLFLLILTLFCGFSAPATALLRTQHESPTQILYQSRHSLRDSQGETWQVVLFKRTKNNQIISIELRLVGFPDLVIFRHPQPLVIVMADRILSAPDQFAKTSPAPNVGQYDFQPIWPQLLRSQTLELDLPLDTSNPKTLKIPYPVMLEWQDIL